MSYGLKYTLTFRDTLYKLGTDYTKLWKINIYANGFSGSATSVIGAESPVQISYKKGSLITAICGSECTIALMALSEGQYDEFLTAAPLGYYVDIQYYNSTSWVTYWSGVNTTDTYSQPEANAPYQCNLKFNCGLGELQWHRYENAGNLTTGIETILEVINNCMTFLPFPNKNICEVINVREDTMSDTAGLLEQLYISDMGITEIGDDGETHGWNCNKLLNAILTSINCRMYQSANQWFIERIYERVNTSVTCFVYQTYSTWQTANDWLRSGTWPKGTQVNSFNWTRTINNSAIPLLQKGSEKAVTQMQPILTYKFDPYNGIGNMELIPNPFLENTPINKDINNRPLRWLASSGYPFTCSAGGTVLTFASSAIVSQIKFGIITSIQLVVGGVVLTKHVVSTSGATITISVKIDNVTTSGYSAGVQQVGGDGLETIDPYDPNPLYQSGYSFGQAIVAANKAYIDANYPSYVSNPNTNFPDGSPYYIHALRSPNETSTLPWIFCNPDISEVVVDLRQYVRFKISPQYTNKPTYAQTYADAMNLFNCAPGMITTWRASLTNQNTGNTYYLTGHEEVQGGGTMAFIQYGQPYMWIDNAITAMFATFPYQVGVGHKYGGPTSGAPSLAAMQSWFANSWNGVNCNPFYLCFDTETSNTVGLNATTSNPMPSTGAPYTFDFVMYPPYPTANGVLTNSYGSTFTISLDDWALRSIDIQYKEAAQSASANVAFYSTSAGDTRWNELVITATFGDTDTNGFPASFLLYTGLNTGTWHNRTVGDTGQVLADIFFKNFAQIPAVYRPNLRGNVIYDNALEFHMSVVDEDGEVYLQIGHTFEVKYNKFTTDMEGMADTGLPITPIHRPPFTPFVGIKQLPTPAVAKLVTPLTSPTKTTPIKTQTNGARIIDSLYPI